MSVAVEEGLLTDATSRNALYKIHVSLGKIVNSLDEQQGANAGGNRRQSRSASVAETQIGEGKTVVEEPAIKEEDDESDGTVVPQDEQGTVVEGDDEDTKMQE